MHACMYICMYICMYVCVRDTETLHIGTLFHESGTACFNVLYAVYGHISILHPCKRYQYTTYL